MVRWMEYLMDDYGIGYIGRDGVDSFVDRDVRTCETFVK